MTSGVKHKCRALWVVGLLIGERDCRLDRNWLPPGKMRLVVACNWQETAAVRFAVVRRSGLPELLGRALRRTTASFSRVKEMTSAKLNADGRNVMRNLIVALTSFLLLWSAGSEASSELKSTGAMTSGRIFLSPAQTAEAQTSGIVNRPIKSLLDVRLPLTYGSYVWNDAAVPKGPTWIRVDLRSQLISVFMSGHEIGTAVIVYGADNKQTPAGTLHILSKAKEHRSSLYDAEMPFTLRLTGDGVSIHGSKVRAGAASHGCIGVPLEFARRLFGAARVGDEVIITGPRTLRKFAGNHRS